MLIEKKKQKLGGHRRVGGHGGGRQKSMGGREIKKKKPETGRAQDGKKKLGIEEGTKLVGSRRGGERGEKGDQKGGTIKGK